jgi:hypothetical protein
MYSYRHCFFPGFPAMVRDSAVVVLPTGIELSSATGVCNVLDVPALVGFTTVVGVPATAGFPVVVGFSAVAGVSAS